MHTINTLLHIRSHTDLNSVPDGLIHISENITIDALVVEIGKYIKEEFYLTSISKEPKIHIDEHNHSLFLKGIKYPHFNVLHLIQYVLAGKYTIYLDQAMQAKGIFHLLIADNKTINDFASTESFWFDQNFTRLQDDFDGFAELNLQEHRKNNRTSVAIKRSKDYGKNTDPVYNEWRRKNTLNDFPIWGFVLGGLMMLAGICTAYITVRKVEGDWLYDCRRWNERLSIIQPNPPKIEYSALKEYIGTLADIPSGSFKMGHEKTDFIKDAFPVHEVNIEAFKMMEAEVTFEQWDACVADGSCTNKPEDEGWGRGNQPVINISYNDIVDEYLPWIYTKTGYKLSLPSEAQWEYAARGGTTTFYAFGDSVICGTGNFGRHYSSRHRFNSKESCTHNLDNRQPITVKSYLPNAYGLYDMHGNVGELVRDQYIDNYKNAHRNGTPQYDLSVGIMKQVTWSTLVAVRGGNFSTSKLGIHVAFRENQGTSYDWETTGFRLVLNTIKE